MISIIAFCRDGGKETSGQSFVFADPFSIRGIWRETLVRDD